MDRRTFLKTSTIAAAASTATVGAGQTMAAPAVVVSRAELQIAAAPNMADAARALTRDIEIASDSRIVINLVEAAARADEINAGGVDGAIGLLSEICAAPELALFSGLPGTMAMSPEHLLAWQEAAGGGMYLEEAAAQFNLAAIIAGHSGAGTGLWAGSEIPDLRAFAQAQIVTTGFGPAIVDHITGAYGQPVSERSEIPLAESELAPIEAFLKLPPDCRQIWYRDGLHKQGFATSLVLSRDVWDKIGPGDQLLIATLARAAAYADVARNRVSDRLVAPAVMNSLPVRCEPLAADIAVAIQHVATEIVHDAMPRNATMNPAFQAYGAFYQAMIGVALPRPRNMPIAGV